MLVEVDGTANGDHEVVKVNLRPAEAADLAAAGTGGYVSRERTPGRVNWPGALDEPSCLFSCRRPGIGVGSGGLLACSATLTEIHCTPPLGRERR
jgi:hypothetical protein